MKEVTYKTKGSAGADLRADLKGQSIEIHTGQVYKIPTGVFFKEGLPEGIEGQVRCRSGMAVKGICLVNGVGTIDSDYTGEICLIITNVFSNPVTINHGDRVAQIVFAKYEQLIFPVEDQERYAGGFGSTGVK